MAQSSYDLLVKIMGDATSLNAALREADEQTQNRFGKMQQYAQGATIALGGIALAAGLAVKSMLDQAAQMETYRTKLTTVFKDSAKAAETMRAAVEFAAKTPFEVKGIVDATVTLSVYRQKAEEILPLVGDLAAAMGARIEDTAQAVGKAMSGSLEGWEQLRNTYGVTIERLKAFGAAIDGQGQMLTKNANDLERNRKALLAVIATDFGGGMERQSKTFSGAMSNLQDSVTNLQASIGETLIPAATSAAQTISGMVGAINKMPEALKSVAGYGIAAGGGLAALAAGATGLVALAPGIMTLKGVVDQMQAARAATVLASNSFVDMSIPATGLATKIGGAGMALGIYGTVAIGAALAIKAVQDEWIKAAEAEDKMTVATSNNITVAKESVTWIGKTSKELREMGVALSDIPKAMDGFRELAKAALEMGRTDLAKKYQQQMRDVRDAGIALSEYNKKIDEGRKLAEDNAKLTEHNAKIGLASARDIVSAEEQKLSAMRAAGATKDEIWDQEEKVFAARKKAEDEDQKSSAASAKAADDSAKVHLQANEDKLAASLHFIDRKRSLNQMSEAEEISALQRVMAAAVTMRSNALADHTLNEEQRKNASDFYAKQIQDIRERMEDVAKKRSDSAREAITKNLDEERKKAEDVAQKKAEAEEKAKQARIKAAEAAAAAVTSSYDKELDAARKAAKGKIDEEVFFLQQKMKTLEAEQSKYLFGKLMYNDGKGDVRYQEDAMKYNAMEASKAKFKEAIASAQEQQEEQRRQRQVEAYRKQEEAVMGNTRKYSEEQRVRFGMEMENFYRRNGMEEDAIRLHKQILDLQQQISDKAIKEAKIIVDGAEKRKAAREEALTLSVKELANSTEQARVLKQAADDAVRLASSVGKFMGFTAAGKWGKSEAKTSGTSTTTSKPTISLGTMPAESAGDTFSPGSWEGIFKNEQLKEQDKSTQKQGDAADKQKEAATVLQGASEAVRSSAEGLSAAEKRLQDFVNRNIQQAGFSSGLLGGISSAGAGGFYGGGGTSVSNQDLATSGPRGFGSTGGYEWGMAETGREVSTQELMQLRSTPGWYESGNSWSPLGEDRWWVTSSYGKPAPKQGAAAGAGGGAAPINLTANIAHTGGTSSPWDISTTDTGSAPATFHQGRTGVSPSSAGAATSQQEITINVPLYVDSTKVGGAVASKTLAQGFGTTSWDNMAAFS